MASIKAVELLSSISRAKNTISRVTIQTTYGLVVEVTEDSTLNIRLSDSLDETAVSGSLPKSEQPGYRYYILPDYQTSFVWYKSDWPGNPSDETHVDEDVLEERYGELWAKAFGGWVEKYTLAFEAHECQFGSHQDPLPDPTERAAWVVEGVLLAAWLALQPGVDAVEFDDDLGTSTCTLEKTGLAATVAKLLGKLGQK
jgi:hypothetical protein